MVALLSCEQMFTSSEMYRRPWVGHGICLYSLAALEGEGRSRKPKSDAETRLPRLSCASLPRQRSRARRMSERENLCVFA